MFFIAAHPDGGRRRQPGRCRDHRADRTGLRRQVRISPLLMGLMVVHGAQGGGFSPISIYGGITNKIVERAGLPLSELTTMFASLGVNFVVCLGLFLLLGGRKLLGQRAGDGTNGGDAVGAHFPIQVAVAQGAPRYTVTPRPKRSRRGTRRSGRARTRLLEDQHTAPCRRQPPLPDTDGHRAASAWPSSRCSSSSTSDSCRSPSASCFRSWRPTSRSAPWGRWRGPRSC